MNQTEEKILRKRKESLAVTLKEGWEIEKFLEVFPQPVGYFEDPRRNSHISKLVCLNYLRDRFPRVFSTDIEDVLMKNNGNLVQAALALRRWKGIRRPARSKAVRKFVVGHPDITEFTIEKTYIENRKQIREYFLKKEARKREYTGELLTCLCCFEDDLYPEDMIGCKEGHDFCKTCIKRGSEIVIGNGKSCYSCLNGDCKAEFNLIKLEGILDDKVLKKLVQNKQTKEINAAGIEGLETCPSCPYAAIPHPEDKIFKCLNPDCLKITCRKCKGENHLPLRCEEVQSTQVKMRTYIENKMTEALVRTCWKCKTAFIKETGCNKMTCSCGAMMCYLCRQPVTDYTHFDQFPDTKSKKCPLFTDDKKLDFNAIKSEATKAKRQVMSLNPNVKLVHDPTLFLQRNKK